MYGRVCKYVCACVRACVCVCVCMRERERERERRGKGERGGGVGGGRGASFIIRERELLSACNFVGRSLPGESELILYSIISSLSQKLPPSLLSTSPDPFLFRLSLSFTRSLDHSFPFYLVSNRQAAHDRQRCSLK